MCSPLIYIIDDDRHIGICSHCSMLTKDHNWRGVFVRNNREPSLKYIYKRNAIQKRNDQSIRDIFYVLLSAHELNHYSNHFTVPEKP